MQEALTASEISTHVDEIDIHHGYVSHDEAFTHVLFNWRVKNVYLAVVVDNRRMAIHGHRLDLNALYGVT